MYRYQLLYRQIWSKNFFCSTNHLHLVSFFITALEGLATQNKAQRKFKVIVVETAIKIKLSKLMEQLEQRHNRTDTLMDFVDDCIVDSEEQELSTQFLQL